ncbi:hypothetical protein I302_104537 [Kwoniella bestiolae CBS 10118]|uniref:SnoaL-like domain-containing protein n=1 Tax=Kwoniella bestiolae CBS 10118 TaxID=1296100 RepID=A0A1B9GBJ0_9TREE|nr:hypothetical protein I302_03242 [Kwoniella bestiolae CBS 10118]OCF28383.1 hypothetical protein I302_03242 [Kwoniella bestiolae CBS 10118]
MTVKESYVQQLIQLQINGDWPNLMAHISDDVEWMIINPVVKSTPLSGLYHGKAEYQAAVTPLFTIFEERAKFTLEHLTVAGNTAVAEMKGIAIGAKDKKDFVGFWCNIFEFEETDSGEPQVKRIREYMDSALVKEFVDKNL